LRQDSFTHETTLSLYGPEGKSADAVGDIDVRITYVVDSFGTPTRIRFDENDHPAEAPEINVVYIEMLDAPKVGSKAVYIDCWDWLHDFATDWATEHSAELAAVASLNIEGRRGAA